MTASEVKEDGAYWMRVPGVDWCICKVTFLQMEGYGKVLHVIRPGETWHVPVSHEAEFVGPIQKPK
jgi:hypothetical protein